MQLSLTRSFNFIRPMMSPSATKARLRGVVFDMDGTLTVPVIDFQAMYKAVLGEERYLSVKAKNPTGIDILHHIESWDPYEQQRAYEIIADYERQGLDRLQIMPGAAELCDFLDSKKIRCRENQWPQLVQAGWLEILGIHVRFKDLRNHKRCWHWEAGSSMRGLITRNVKSAVDIFHLRFGSSFSPALSREFRPYKPDPAPLLHICTSWGVQPSEVIMIGDSLKDDVACGKRAGAYTCLLDQTGRYDSPDFSDIDQKPDFKVSSLAEVHSLLEARFDLRP